MLKLVRTAAWLSAAVLLVASSAPMSFAQSKKTAERLDEAEKQAAAALAEPAAPEAPQPAATPAPAGQDPIDIFHLWFHGGGELMYPITFMSFLVVVFGVERALGLRRSKVIPSELVEGFGKLASRSGGLDPREAYHLCQKIPSTASRVIRSVLLKVGRPQSEVEHTFTEAKEREAARLYKNVRPLNLAVTVAPLLGLLGTVQGMILCFYNTANLPVGVDRSHALADGIYKALVTTFGGLVVAIPAAVLAHYFEGRIQELFREIDELLLGFLPQLERYEGKLRLTRQASASSAVGEPASEPTPPPVSAAG